MQSYIKKYAKKKPRKVLKKRRRNRFIGSEVRYIDYKDVELLEKFVNIHGKILSSRVTGLSSTQQKSMAQAIKRSRYMALMPYTIERTKKI